MINAQTIHTPRPANLSDVLSNVREIHERLCEATTQWEIGFADHMAGYEDDPRSAVVSAILLHEQLAKLGQCHSVKICSGFYAIDDETEHPHFWVKAMLPAGETIFDVTADRFGGEKITALPARLASWYEEVEQEITDDFIRAFLPSGLALTPSVVLH